MAAAIFAVIYYSGLFLPHWARWHDIYLDIQSGRCIADGEELRYEEIFEEVDEPDTIKLENRKVKVYKEGKCIFKSPKGCFVQNMLYADIDRDGERELILLNFNKGRYGKHRPFWVDRDELKWFQHIYIYDYIAEDKMFRPIWMASDIGMEAADFSLEEEQVIRMEDRHGEKSDWMWISFGLRCVD